MHKQNNLYIGRIASMARPLLA